MRGWALFHRPYSAVLRRQAQQAFARALEIDPRSVEAKIGIATVLVANVGESWSSSVEQDKTRAEQLLLDALERDANIASAHFAMGHLRRLQNRLAESKIELKIALDLDRNQARALRQLGMTLMYLGEPEVAIPHIKRAIRLNPQTQIWETITYLWVFVTCFWDLWPAQSTFSGRRVPPILGSALSRKPGRSHRRIG
jgi:adenylate cyclase